MNIKSILLFVLSISLVLCRITNAACQEERINIIVSDSFQIHHPDGSALIGYTSFEDGKIKFITSNVSTTPEVFYYDLEGKLLERISLDVFTNRKDMIRMGGFDKTASGFLVYDLRFNKFYYLDKSFRIIDSKKLKPKFESTKYKIVAGPLYLKYSFYPQKQFAVFPINPNRWKGVNSKNRYHKGGEKFYHTPGLMGLFDSNGEIIQTFGTYDEVYQGNTFLPHLDDTYFNYNENNEVLFIGQRAAPNIQVYDLSSFSKLGDFGESGKFISVPPDSLVGLKSSKDHFEHTYIEKLIIESPEYNGIYYHDALDLVFRFYRTSLTDTTTIDSTYLQMLEELQKSKVMGCPAPSEQKLNQRKLMESKPNYLQIYSGHKRFDLIYDQAIPSQVIAPNILGHDQEHLYIKSSYFFNSNKMTIYKFKVEVLD